MKKFLQIALLGLVATACSSEADVVVPSEANNAPVATSIRQMFSNGTSMSIGSTSAPARSRAASDVTYEFVEFDITDELKEEIRSRHIDLFPEQVNNLGKDYSADFDNFSHDFLMISDGGTVDVMLLYTCYSNHHNDKFRLFWLDEEGNFSLENTLDLWVEDALGQDLVNKRNKVYMPEGNTAVRFSLPAGTKYGFFFWNEYEGTRHFTRSTMNTQYNEKAINKGVDPALLDAESMLTYMVDGYQVVSMDATFPMTSSYDADVNDVVFLLRADRPKPSGDLIVPVYEATEDIYCEADDFALSNNYERYPEYYNIGADTTRRIFVEKGNHLTVGVTDFDNLVYDEVYNEWTYETWVWLTEVPAEEKYIYGSETEPDWDTFSNGNYLIGVSAYQGIAGQGDTGYVKVSIHIKEDPNGGIGDGIIIDPYSL